MSGDNKQNTDATEGGKGFEFPGRFRITAIGDAEANLPMTVPATLAGLGLTVHHDSLSQRPSSKGNYLSVSVDYDADAREQMEAAQSALQQLDGVKWLI